MLKSCIVDETELTAEDLEALEDGLSYVRGVIEDSGFISDVEIKEALWFYYFDREETVNYLLEKVAKEEKRKAKEAKKAPKGVVDDRKPRYRRPPAKLYSETIQPLKLPNTTKTSLQQLSGTRTRPLSNQSSLRQLLQKSGSDPEGKNADGSLLKSKPAGDGGSSSLRSLAEKSAGKRGVSALQNLASRQTQTTSSAGLKSTAHQDGPPSRPSLATLAQASNSANKGFTSLAHLASRRKTETPVKSNTKPPTASLGLAALAKKSVPAPKKEVQQPMTKPEQPVVTKTIVSPDVPAATTTMVEKATILVPVDNPLCAPPSSAAKFLFSPMDTPCYATTQVQQLTSSLPSSIAQTFYEAVHSSASNYSVFPFDKPSPDDVILKAQSNRSGGKATKT
ncbi:hypothetical protein DFQ30_011427 [Apophysomyces sp. BC1015]|nr:hypothetical protein DFQ30_011427 [Apophysomyces sp. BC1015]